MAIRDNLRKKIVVSGGGTSSGGSSDSGTGGSGTSAIDGGYIVNFYNTDKVLIESHSALFGNWIDDPISYDVHHWENENGHINQFPLTVSTEDSGTSFDLYPVIVGENAVMVIDPSGTDFASAFPLFESYRYMNYAPGISVFNYNENEWRFRPYGANYYNAGTCFLPAIECSEYKYLKVKYLAKYSSGNYFKIYLAKDATEGASGSPANYYRYITLMDSSNPINQYTNITAAQTDLSNSLWQWAVIDISDLENFYFCTQTTASDVYIAEAIMTV